MMPVESKRRRNLVAHNELLVKVITDQAGTVDKGVLEGIMNAREAGSPVVRVMVEDDGKRLVIEDEGKGFCSETEIIEWFETFGTPHKDTEAKIWARFRMGRGQLFAFGHNVWRTGEFRMVVDIQKMGLEYELESGLEPFSGCRIEIELYQPLIGEYPCPYRSMQNFNMAIRKQIEFIEGVVLVNGEQVNTPASSIVWDLETTECYFMFGKGTGLQWYNIGAFVNEWSIRTAGINGVVVSKVPFDVNFARNQIKDACPVFQRARTIVHENRIRKVRKAQRRLTTDEKISTLCDIRDGAIKFQDVDNLGLFQTCNGRVMTLEAIRRIRSPWCFAPADSRLADALIQTNVAQCLSDDVLNELGYDGEEADFFCWLLQGSDDFEKIQYLWEPMKRFWRSFDGPGGLSAGYSRESSIIPTEKLSKAERRFLRVMENMRIWKGRALCIGISDTSNAWTDGGTYIAFNRAYLKNNFPSTSWGAAAIMTLAFHELAHDEDDTGSHLHGLEFYQAYHDMTRGNTLHWIADLKVKMKAVKYEDKAEEQLKREQKQEALRNARLTVVNKKSVKAHVVAGVTGAADGIVFARTDSVKRHKRRRF